MYQENGSTRSPRVLVLTNMYPTREKPFLGIFVKEQVESLMKQGVDVDVLFVNGPKSRINYFWGVFRMWWRLLTRRYDLIHAHYVFSGIIARLQFFLPIVLTHHGAQVFMTWERFPCRFITPLVDRVIVVSEEMRERARYSRAAVIPCGVDFGLFKPMSQHDARRKLDLPTDKKLVLWVGDPNPRKRVALVFQAVALVRKDDPAVELVTLSGKPHEVVPIYMNACDVLVLVSEAEGSPMVVKEAMACNLAVVSVSVGDVPQVIGATPGCYLCDADPSDIARKVAFALARNGRTDGRERIRHLELGNVSGQVRGVYRDLLGAKKGPSWLPPAATRED